MSQVRVAPARGTCGNLRGPSSGSPPGRDLVKSDTRFRSGSPPIRVGAGSKSGSPPSAVGAGLSTGSPPHTDTPPPLRPPAPPSLPPSPLSPSLSSLPSFLRRREIFSALGWKGGTTGSEAIAAGFAEGGSAVGDGLRSGWPPWGGRGARSKSRAYPGPGRPRVPLAPGSGPGHPRAGICGDPGDGGEAATARKRVRASPGGPSTSPGVRVRSSAPLAAVGPPPRAGGGGGEVAGTVPSPDGDPRGRRRGRRRGAEGVPGGRRRRRGVHRGWFARGLWEVVHLSRSMAGHLFTSAHDSNSPPRWAAAPARGGGAGGGEGGERVPGVGGAGGGGGDVGVPPPAGGGPLAFLGDFFPPAAEGPRTTSPVPPGGAARWPLPPAVTQSVAGREARFRVEPLHAAILYNARRRICRKGRVRGGSEMMGTDESPSTEVKRGFGAPWVSRLSSLRATAPSPLPAR